MAGAIFVVNVKEGWIPRYYTFNPTLNQFSGGVLFRLPNKILDSLKYLVLYLFAFCMDIDPVWTALAMH